MNRAEDRIQGDFIREKINNDLCSRRPARTVATRFPPEPNGYLHIGHAKSICLNFGIAAEFRGTCNLRLDDTDPAGESWEYVEAAIENVRWLGFDWEERLYFASAYFERLYRYAVCLIEKGLAYVCSLSPEEIRACRGTLTEPGRESPYRHRSVGENLDLFARMRAGEFTEGAQVLRAKIDMASPNLIMRDPVVYRIKKEPHYRTGRDWCIYPMYDFAHCLSDALEGITHSLCTLEFENNRVLYDWYLAALDIPSPPEQIEFARLNLSYTVLSKRKLNELVERGLVDGWDDPRMPTLAGLRRRGYPPAAIRNFCDRIGVAKNDSLIDISLLEHCLREELNEKAPRAMAVLNPLRLIIENYPEGKVEKLACPCHPKRPELGSRIVPFSRDLFIERDDFQENPPRKFFRLTPGREVRLRYGYIVKCTGVVKDPETGEVVEVRCLYDPASLDQPSDDSRRVRATIHWVSQAHALTGEVRLYERLFRVAEPLAEEGDFTGFLHPSSLKVLEFCKFEASLEAAEAGVTFQFERLGYFCLDSKNPSGKVWLRTVSLRDSWAKAAGEGEGSG